MLGMLHLRGMLRRSCVRRHHGMYVGEAACARPGDTAPAPKGEALAVAPRAAAAERFSLPADLAEGMGLDASLAVAAAAAAEAKAGPGPSSAADGGEEDGGGGGKGGGKGAKGAAAKGKRKKAEEVDLEGEAGCCTALCCAVLCALRRALNYVPAGVDKW